MPATALEKFGRRQAFKSGERIYQVQDATTEAEAITAIQAVAPTTLNDLVLDDISVEEIEGLDYWIGIVQYVASEFEAPEEVGESAFSFNTSGGTKRITQSLQTIASHAVSGTAPDFKGAMNVTSDGVQGVDIIVPQYAFEETHILADATVDNAYKGGLFDLTGEVNSGTFKDFAAGEVLFLGARGSQKGTGNWEITYSFIASPNKTGLTVGEMTGIAKKGWEYLWVRYTQVEDATAKAMVSKPANVYIEKVYELGDFSGLGI